MELSYNSMLLTYHDIENYVRNTMAENGGGGEFFLNAEATKKIQEGIQAISSVLSSETDPPATSSTSHGRCTFNHPQYVLLHDFVVMWFLQS